MAFPWSAGDKLNASDLNQLATNIEASINAGETIAANKALYLDDTDNEWKLCSANNVDKLEFAAFSLESGTDANPMKVQVSGVVSGFSGLDSGKVYYLSDTPGVISITPGTYLTAIGIAISATQLLMMSPISYGAFISDILRVSADTERATASTSYVKLKEITIKKSGTYRVKFDHKASFDVSPDCYARVYKNGAAHGTEHSCKNTSYHTISEDLTFVKGDKCQLYLKAGSGRTSSAKNFRLYFDYLPAMPLPTIDTD